MKNIILLLFCAIFMMSNQAKADGITASITAQGETVRIAAINTSTKTVDTYHGCVNVYGTWNGVTVNWQVSTDDGTTKVALKDLTGVAFTSTANDNFCFKWDFAKINSDQTILYATVSGGASAPTLTVNLFDNR